MDSYEQKTHSQNNKTSSRPPTQPPRQPGDTPKVKTNVPNTKEMSSFLKKNHGKIIGGAIGVGIAKSFIDGDDDDILSSTGKGLKTGALAAGLSYGSEYLLKTETVQDLVKGEVSGASQAMRNQKSEMKMKWIGNKVPGALRVGMYAVGAATLLDVGQRVENKLEADRMEREQERNLRKKQQRQKEKNRELSYGHMQDGELVLELFNQRTGHHKMGNAKFN